MGWAPRNGYPICLMMVSLWLGLQRHFASLTMQGALSVKHLKRIVVDASHTDQKKRGVLDMPDTHLPLVRMLLRPELTARYNSASDGIQLLFY